MKQCLKCDWIRKGSIAAATFAVAIAFTGITTQAATIDLGGAESFGVLAATTVTNTGLTVISGDVGVSPGTAITGFPPGTVNGSMHSGILEAGVAQADATAAYAVLAALVPTQILTGEDLGNRTLTPGVYFFAAAAGLTGTLTLDGQGQSDPLFVFQIGSTLTTAADSSIVTIDGAYACNVFFQVGSSATLGTDTAFEGTIISLASNTLTTGASVEGRVIALTGAVTLDSNNIDVCVIPEPAAIALLALPALAFVRRRRRTPTAA